MRPLLPVILPDPMLLFIASGVVATDFVFVSQKNIKTADQLKGSVLGVSTLSGSAMLATHFALRKLGLDPNKDVSIVVIGQASALMDFIATHVAKASGVSRA